MATFPFLSRGAAVALFCPCFHFYVPGLRCQWGGVLVRVFEDHGLVAVVNAPRIKKFLKTECKAKSLKGGATEPALKQLLPENTYLVPVPRGSTAISMAKIVARHCKRGGDAVDGFDSQPIAVKARDLLSLCVLCVYVCVVFRSVVFRRLSNRQNT